MADREKKFEWLLQAAKFAEKVVNYSLKHKTLPKRVFNSLVEASTELGVAIAIAEEE